MWQFPSQWRHWQTFCPVFSLPARCGCYWLVISSYDESKRKKVFLGIRIFSNQLFWSLYWSISQSVQLFPSETKTSMNSITHHKWTCPLIGPHLTLEPIRCCVVRHSIFYYVYSKLLLYSVWEQLSDWLTVVITLLWKTPKAAEQSKTGNKVSKKQNNWVKDI